MKRGSRKECNGHALLCEREVPVIIISEDFVEGIFMTYGSNNFLSSSYSAGVIGVSALYSSNPVGAFCGILD